jgi:hypothetical protein
MIRYLNDMPMEEWMAPSYKLVTERLMQPLFSTRVQSILARDVLQVLFQYWEKHCIAPDLSAAACAEDFVSVASAEIPLSALRDGLDLRDETRLFRCIYEAADQRILSYDSSRRTASFLHPVDVAIFVMSELSRERESELIRAEKLSLLSPNVPSADEVT